MPPFSTSSVSIDYIMKFVEELAEVRALQCNSMMAGNHQAAYNFEAQYHEMLGKFREYFYQMDNAYYKVTPPFIINKSDTFEDAVNGLIYYDPEMLKDVKMPELYSGIGKSPIPGPTAWKEVTEAVKLATKKAEEAVKKPMPWIDPGEEERQV
jgi:hypothetical protein